jgi:signal transduction histidine kinase
LQAAANLPRVLADAMQIEVVLRNLIVNAIESAAALRARPGRVQIGIALAAEEITVRVHDSGAGFAAVDAERLFASFTTTKTSGMGMGLAISRAIVEAHGGRIRAVPGDGGEVCFTLPVASAVREGHND